jgi:hypothetical protein
VSNLADVIPGLREAEEREGSAWDAAWLGLNESICGIEVKPFTPRHDLMLGWNGLRSPFLGGPWPEDGLDLVAHINAFMWGVSPGFAPNQPLREFLFIRRLRKSPAGKDVKSLIAGIARYAQEAYADAPSSGGYDSPSFNSWFSDACDLFGAEYGWRPEDIIDRPMKQIWQLLKSLRARRNPGCHLFKPSDRIIGAWLDEKNRRAGSDAHYEAN